jgi:hypothetical protein
MGRPSYLSIGEIAEHLPMLTVQCDRCGRAGRYSTAKLVEQYGAEATVQPFEDDLTRDARISMTQDTHSEMRADDAGFAAVAAESAAVISLLASRQCLCAALKITSQAQHHFAISTTEHSCRALAQFSCCLQHSRHRTGEAFVRS